jgi:hypothetical protein
MVSDGTMVAGQVRYQLTLMLRTPRTLMAGLILPGALLALQLGRVQPLARAPPRMCSRPGWPAWSCWAR